MLTPLFHNIKLNYSQFCTGIGFLSSAGFSSNFSAIFLIINSITKGATTATTALSILDFILLFCILDNTISKPYRTYIILHPLYSGSYSY